MLPEPGWQDQVNGTLEAIGGIVIWANVRRLVKDKQVKGWDWRVQLFFSIWGIWNLYYYPFLNQWSSFFGGLFVTVASTVWVYLAWRYTYGKD